MSGWCCIMEPINEILVDIILVNMLKIWVVLFAVIAIAQVPLHIIGQFSNAKGASTNESMIDPTVPINQFMTRHGERKWFSLFDDILYRYSLVVIAFYWNIFTYPLGFFYYSFRF